MTISSLAKIIVGVNRMVVENVEIEYNNQSSGKNKTNGKISRDNLEHLLVRDGPDLIEYLWQPLAPGNPPAAREPGTRAFVLGNQGGEKTTFKEEES